MEYPLDGDEYMAWFRWSGKKAAENSPTSEKEVDFRAKTEQKLLLARQDPDPVFDLTRCNLHDVPSGVYAWCKVCRKEVLLLRDNRLRSVDGSGNCLKDLFLLRVLDLSHNKIAKLPESIGSVLPNLHALYLQHNRIKALPHSTPLMAQLRTLNLKGNRLKAFPEVICHLPYLRRIDLSDNPKEMDKIPASFCSLRNTLLEMVIDAQNYKTPPTEICTKGLEAIMSHLCHESGVEYSKGPSSLDNKGDPQHPLDFSAVAMETKDWTSWTSSMASTTRKEGEGAGSETEKEIQASLERLSRLAEESEARKAKMLRDLVHDNSRLDDELGAAQRKKDAERKKLVEELIDVEEGTMNAIRELLDANASQKNAESILETLENERKEFEELFSNVQNESIEFRRGEVLRMMEEAIAWEKKGLGNGKGLLPQLILEQERRMEEALCMEQSEKEERRKSLMRSLLEDNEDFQKRAFAAMLLARDNRVNLIAEQIVIVESELAKLTYMELQKQSSREEHDKRLLEEERRALALLLMQLMEQQDIRQKEFEKRLCELESRRSQQQVDYWLIQFQRLMDSKPIQLQALGFQPEFPSAPRMSTEEEEEEEVDRGATVHAPTAPPKEEEEGTGGHGGQRGFLEAECVICMDAGCNVLFLDCGHVCCCDGCGMSMKQCPLCRSDIQNMFYLHRQRPPLPLQTPSDT